jgi:hypothetical protein
VQHLQLLPLAAPQVPARAAHQFVFHHSSEKHWLHRSLK